MKHMSKKGYEQYDYGIYRGNHKDFDPRNKQENLSTHTRLMLNKSLNMFEYHNLPDTVPERELERILQTSGYVGWTEVEGKVYALWGGLGGVQDEYYRPTQMTVANPGLKLKNGNSFSKTLTIGEDVVLMRNDDNMVGLIPIFGKYGTLMNETDLTIYITLINKRADNIISASDDNTAESARQYLKKLEEGEIGYIQETKLYDSLKTNPTKSGVSGSSFTELIELQQYLKGSMYNEIGLNANFNMKRERLNTSEVEMNSETLYPLVDNMLYNRREALKEVNEKFGLNIEVEFNSSWDYRLGKSEDTGETPLEFLADDELEDHIEEYITEDVETHEDESLHEEVDIDLETDESPSEGELDLLEDEEVIDNEETPNNDIEREGHHRDTGEPGEDVREPESDNESPSTVAKGDDNRPKEHESDIESETDTDIESETRQGDTSTEEDLEDAEEVSEDVEIEQDDLEVEDITQEDVEDVEEPLIIEQEIEVETPIIENNENEGDTDNGIEKDDRRDTDVGDTGRVPNEQADTGHQDVRPGLEEGHTESVENSSTREDILEDDTEESEDIEEVEEVEQPEEDPKLNPMSVVRIIQKLNPFKR